MLGYNAREFVVSLPKQQKYTSEQMSLFSIEKVDLSLSQIIQIIHWLVVRRFLSCFLLL